MNPSSSDYKAPTCISLKRLCSTFLWSSEKSVYYPNNNLVSSWDNDTVYATSEGSDKPATASTAHKHPYGIVVYEDEGPVKNGTPSPIT